MGSFNVAYMTSKHITTRLTPVGLPLAIFVRMGSREDSSSLTTLKGLRDKADNGKYSCSST